MIHYVNKKTLAAVVLAMARAGAVPAYHFGFGVCAVLHRGAPGPVLQAVFRLFRCGVPPSCTDTSGAGSIFRLRGEPDAHLADLSVCICTLASQTSYALCLLLVGPTIEDATEQCRLQPHTLSSTLRPVVAGEALGSCEASCFGLNLQDAPAATL